ncbi:MAG: hypothetical protein ACRER2_15695 [Methylococcales bacterium]
MPLDRKTSIAEQRALKLLFIDDFRLGDAVRVTVVREGCKAELTLTLQAGG